MRKDTPKLGNIIEIDEGKIRNHLGEFVRGSVEETLNALLERLSLPHLAMQVDTVCEQAAKNNLDFRSFLSQALDCEWRGRHQKAVGTRLAQSRFPWIKTLEQYDFDFQPSIDRRLMREMATLAFVERAENVIFLGLPGVGKTHLQTRDQPALPPHQPAL